MATSFQIQPTPQGPVIPGLLNNAIQEGRVTLYSVFNIDFLDWVKKSFEKKYPQITLEYVNPGAGVAMEKYLTEYRAGKHIMDAFWGTATYILPALKEGIVAKYVSPEDTFIQPDQRDPEGFWTSPALAPQTIAWNTEKVKKDEIPASWWDVLKPRFKDRIGCYDARIVPASILILKKKVIGSDRWLEWLKGFRAQNVRNLRTSGPLIELLKTGEIEIGAFSWAGTVTAAVRQGAPMDYSRAKGILLGHVEPYWIYRYAPHPNAARLLKDYILSAEGQNAFNELGQYIPTRVGIASKMGLGVGSGVIAEAKNVTEVFPYTQEELEAVVNDWNTYFEK